MSDLNSKISSILNGRDKNKIEIITTNRRTIDTKVIGVRSYEKASSFDKAVERAYQIITENKLKCDYNEQEEISAGHAIQVTENGQTSAIIIDLTTNFKKENLSNGYRLLAKHSTEKVSQKAN